MNVNRGEFRMLAALRVQQLLMLDDAWRGRVGEAKVWEGRPYYRWGPLRWCRAGLMLEEDMIVLTYDRKLGLLSMSDHFRVPPLPPQTTPIAWEKAWPVLLRPALLRYEQHCNERRLDHLDVPSIWRSAWWLELGSMVPGRVDDLLLGLSES